MAKKMSREDSPGLVQIVSANPIDGVMYPTSYTAASGSTTVTPGWKKARREGGNSPKKNPALKKKKSSD